MTIKIDAGKDYYERAIGLYIFDIPDYAFTSDGVEHRVSIVTEIKMEVATPGTYRDPSFKISLEAAQGLMDALWNCNIRPTDQQDRSGEISALKAHIADLQRLVFSMWGAK